MYSRELRLMQLHVHVQGVSEQSELIPCITVIVHEKPCIMHKKFWGMATITK